MELTFNVTSKMPVSKNSSDKSVVDGISDDVTDLLNLTLAVLSVNGLLSFFGMLTNTINICVFVKQLQACKETMNISLLALCLADLGCNFTLLWKSICLSPAVQRSGISFNPVDLGYLTGTLPRAMFTRVSSWIHVYITFERCLCIAMPLKIKSMVTPAVSVTSMLLIYLLLMLTILPMYLSAHIEWTTSPVTNTSRYSRVYNVNGNYLERIGLSLSFAVMVSSYFIDVVFTLIIIRQLQEKRKWRNETARVVVPGSENSLSTRDRKVIKMVMVVSSLFIVCSFPGCVHYIGGIISSEHYNPVVSPNLFLLVSSTVETCEQITYATNIFIFYKMSSRYKMVFWQFFGNAISRGGFVQGPSTVIE